MDAARRPSPRPSPRKTTTSQVEVVIPEGYFPSLHEFDHPFREALTLPYLAIEHSYMGIVITIVSAIICWAAGYAAQPVIDSLIFKSIFIIFGFTMGFRNVRANQRYNDCMVLTSKFIAAFWGIYSPLPRDVRKRNRASLVNATREAAEHIHHVGCNIRACWYGMANLQPAPTREDEETNIFAAMGSAQGYGSATTSPHGNDMYGMSDPEDSGEFSDSPMSPTASVLPRHASPRRKKLWAWEDEEKTHNGVLTPRIKLMIALCSIEAEIERLEPWNSGRQKMKRGFWFHKQLFLSCFDDLLALSFPSVNERYMTFVDLTLFVFSCALPWGIEAHPITVHLPHHNLLHVSSGIILVVNTTLVVMVMYTLNAITCQNENPLSGDKDDIDLMSLIHILELTIEANEKTEESAYRKRKALKAAASGIAGEEGQRRDPAPRLLPPGSMPPQ